MEKGRLISGLAAGLVLRIVGSEGASGNGEVGREGSDAEKETGGENEAVEVGKRNHRVGGVGC